MNQRDIKLLWGRAGGVCARCRKKLSEDPTRATEAFPLGEQAHIVGEKEDAARGLSPLTADERDGYTNRILLCPTCHTVIDNAPADYPVERLHIIKREHELWVEQQLATASEAQQVGNEIYASLIDACVDLGDLMTWNFWTAWAVSSSARWRPDGKDRAYSLAKKIHAAAWPGVHVELERALKTFAYCLNAAAQRFWQESETRDEYRVDGRFYKGADPGHYDAMLDRYERWVSDCDALVIRATKAANWLADVVRRDLNPRFFAIEGRFALTMEDRLDYVTQVPEFTDEEKTGLPEDLFENEEKPVE